MTISKANQRTFHRRLYAGMLKTITVLKRGDDQAEGTVVSLTLFECRRGQIFKTGEQIVGDMTSSFRTTWHIPRIQMDRVGISYFSSLDRIIEFSTSPLETRTWQPESNTNITKKLFEDHECVECLLFSVVNTTNGKCCPYN